MTLFLISLIFSAGFIAGRLKRREVAKPDVISARLRRIENTLRALYEQGQTIMGLAEDQAKAITKIDVATTKIATNQQVIGDIATKISDEIDDFLAATPVGTPLTQEMVDQITALGEKATNISDASDALVPVLQGIASKGHVDPVPVEVPPTPEQTSPSA